MRRTAQLHCRCPLRAGRAHARSPLELALPCEVRLDATALLTGKARAKPLIANSLAGKPRGQLHFAGGSDAELLHVVGVDVYGVSEVDTTRTLPISVSGLKDNACFREIPDGSLRGAIQDPNPLEFSVESPLSNDAPGLSVVWRTEGEIGDIAWYYDDVSLCAEGWRPDADDLQQGTWASTMQAVRNAEWDWKTVQRRFSEYITEAGETRDFVLFDGTGDSPFAENVACFAYGGGANDVVFEDLTANGSEVYLVMDRSGSMGTQDGESGNTRMENAISGAIAYLSNSYQRLQDSSDSVDVGHIWYDDELRCSGIEGDPCALSDVSILANAEGIANSVAGLTPRGTTALVDATRLAANELEENAAAGREKYIYLVTDGYENASTNPDIPSLISQLNQQSVTVFALAVGEDADAQFLAKITDSTGGMLFYSESADFVGNAYHLMTNQSRGGAAIIPEEDLVSYAPPLPGQAAGPGVQFEVSEGAEELVVVLGNAGYYKPGYPGELIDWDLDLTLSNGTEVYEKSGDVMDPEITLYSDSLLHIRVPEPTPGLWELTTSAPDGRALQSKLSVTAFDPNAKVFVGVEPRFASEEDTVTVEPSISYGGVALDANWAECSGVVDGPAGFSQELSFSNTALRLEAGEPPQAVLTELNGRGFYRVTVECRVDENARPLPNTSVFEGPANSVQPLPFQYTAIDFFYLNSSQMPTDLSGDGDGDHDNDGILDIYEPPGDADGDGFDNEWDTDADGDDIPDSIEGREDSDGDGLIDSVDLDSDNDGVSDMVEGGGDADGDGLLNTQDEDSDNDGIPDALEGGLDTDGDGLLDCQDPDSDDDGILDAVEGGGDADGDGLLNSQDLDSDDDGIPDAVEGGLDTDGDGLLDSQDLDSDDDGVADVVEGGGDADGDGLINSQDPDSDDDGILDAVEGDEDPDGDGLINSQDTDSDNDGMPDDTDPDPYSACPFPAASGDCEPLMLAGLYASGSLELADRVEVTSLSGAACPGSLSPPRHATR